MVKQRAVCLNCMDGRVQLPVIHWIKENHDVDFVDMVTEAGMDGLLADYENSVHDIYRSIGISVEKNEAKLIFVVGHHDCRGNPISDEEHKVQIQHAAFRIKKKFPHLHTFGLWVNSDWQVELQPEVN